MLSCPIAWFHPCWPARPHRYSPTVGVFLWIQNLDPQGVARFRGTFRFPVGGEALRLGP